MAPMYIYQVYLKNDSVKSGNSTGFSIVLFSPTFAKFKNKIFKVVPELENELSSFYYYDLSGCVLRIRDEYEFDAFFQSSIDTVYIICKKSLTVIPQKNNFVSMLEEYNSRPSMTLMNSTKDDLELQSVRDFEHVTSAKNDNLRLSEQLKDRVKTLSHTFNSVVFQLEDIANVVDKSGVDLKCNASKIANASTSTSELQSEKLDKSTTMSQEDITSIDSNRTFSEVEQDLSFDLIEDKASIDVAPILVPIESTELADQQIILPQNKSKDSHVSNDSWTYVSESNDELNSDEGITGSPKIPEIKIQPSSILFTDLPSSMNNMVNQKQQTTSSQQDDNGNKAAESKSISNDSGPLEVPVEQNARIEAKENQSIADLSDKEVESLDNTALKTQLEKLQEELSKMHDLYEKLSNFIVERTTESNESIESKDKDTDIAICNECQGNIVEETPSTSENNDDQEPIIDEADENNLIETEADKANTTPMHSDPRINEGLMTLIGMGFSNEDLESMTKLLELVDGNVESALELMPTESNGN